MNESTLIIAFDQHAASMVAAVLLRGQRTPALHELWSDLPTIGRFVDRVARRGPVRCCTRRVLAGSGRSDFSRRAMWRVTSLRRR